MDETDLHPARHQSGLPPRDDLQQGQIVGPDRAQPGAGVNTAGKGRASRALELDVAANAGAVEDLAHENRPAIAQLWNENAELVPRISHADRLGSAGNDVATEDLREGVAIDRIDVQPQVLRERPVERDQAWPRHWRRIQPGKEMLRETGIAIGEGRDRIGHSRSY